MQEFSLKVITIVACSHKKMGSLVYFLTFKSCEPYALCPRQF
jgi:hypothetical protein